METFYMTDLIPLLGLPNPPYGQTSYYVQCPCCDENPRKRHLILILQKMFLDVRDVGFQAVYSICIRCIQVCREIKYIRH